LALLLILTSACSEDKRGLDINYPQDVGMRWQYDIQEYYDGDTSSIGSLELHNAEIGQFQRRDGIMRTRLVERLDSLSGTAKDSIVYESYYDLSDDFSWELYASDFYRIFDTMLGNQVLDTLAAQDPAGDDYQYFYEYEPGWITFASFDADAATPYRVQSEQTFYLDFKHRGTRIHGSVDIKTSGVYWGTETINLPIQDSVETYVIKNTMYFDYDLQRDTVAVQPFRETMDWWLWIHPNAGIVRRDRNPFTLTVPGEPSRGPLIHTKGERWELTGLKGLSLSQ
jgi:hypothetical protein